MKTVDCIHTPSTWPWVSPGHETQLLFSVYFIQVKESKPVWGLCWSISALCFYIIKHRGCSTCLRVDRECQVPWKTVQVQDCAVSITVLICRGPWSELPPELYLGFGLEEMQLIPSKREPRSEQDLCNAGRQWGPENKPQTQALPDSDTHAHVHVVALILKGLFNTHQSYVLFLFLNTNQKVTKESLRDKICSPPRSQGYWTAALGLLFCEQHCHWLECKG